MITIDRKRGKLIEVRIQTPVTLDEIASMVRSIGALVSTYGMIRGVIDLRGATVFSEEVASKIVDVFKADNPNLERTAYLAGTDSAVLGLQLERVIRDGKSLRRRMFRERAAAQTWLGEVLTLEEKRRMAEFLDENEGAASSRKAP